MSKTCIIAFLMVTLVPLKQAIAQDDVQPKGGNLKGFKEASAVVNVFVDGLRDGDLDAVLATVDVPWWQDGTKVIESKDVLRELISEPIREKEFAGAKLEILEVVQFGAIRTKVKGSAGELLKQVAKDKDLLFTTKVTIDKRINSMVFLVRVAGDEAKIIGLRD